MIFPTRTALAAASLLPWLTLGATVIESVPTPDGWTVAGQPDGGLVVTLQVALAQQNIDQMTSQLYAASTPGHSQYGKYMDRDDLNNLIKPTADANTAIQNWLKTSGCTDVSSDGFWVQFSTSVDNVSKLLSADFQNYQKGDEIKLRTTQYSVPDDLAQHVDLINPTTFFGSITANAPMIHMEHSEKRQATVTQPNVPAACSQTLTPSCIKGLYNVGNYKASPNTISKVGFSAFLNQSALYTDLALYEKAFGIPNRNFTVETIAGGVNDQTVTGFNAIEAGLDVQNLVGVTSGSVPIVEYITGGSPPFIPDITEPTDSNEPYVPYYRYLLDQTNAQLPQVISNSYGEDEQTVPPKYASRVCNMIGQLGMRGISVLVGSGDYGVGAGCRSNDGKNTTQYDPVFPASCPFITTVGGTQNVNPEIAWIHGGGGFSRYFPMPDYQKSTVNGYLQKNAAALAPFKKYFNSAGRAYPDLAAHSDPPFYANYFNGVASPGGGASAACPTVAGIVALLNDARFAKGQPALGFLNPWLYTVGSKYVYDITSGRNMGCNKTNPGTLPGTDQPIPEGADIPGAGFNATVGWDPVTGFGVPNFQAALNAIRGGYS